MNDNVNNSNSPAQIKQELRETVRNRRRALSEADRTNYAQAIAKRFLNSIPLMPQSVIGGYWPVRTEVNTENLIERLIAQGHILSLPVMNNDEDRLFFRRYRMGDILLPGRFNLPQPLEAAEQMKPHILIVPMIGFTRSGHRLGYGKGYYDKTLAKKRAEKPITAIGVAFSVQEIAEEELPIEPHDQPLDWIVTEEEVIKIL